VRDDRIEICGPFEDPPLEVPSYTDEDGQLVPAHTLDLSHVRRFVLEIRSCSCGMVHGYTVTVHWYQLLAYPQLLERALESASLALVRHVRDCEAS
jgi:hypothetical protein